MAQTKLYQPLKGAVVAPSKVESIEINATNPVRYRVRNCKGVVGNGIRYSDNTTTITMISKDENGKVIEGIQPEQLVLIVKDYLSKQENPDTAKIDALEAFLSVAE